MINIQQIAKQISAAARTHDQDAFDVYREHQRRRLRLRPQCQLRNYETVLLALNAISAGLSHKKAAKAAGIAEPTFRLWMKNGAIPDADGDHPYTLFRWAVRAIENALKPPPPPKPVQVAPVVRVAPPPPPKPYVPPVNFHRWRVLLDRSAEFLKARGPMANIDGADMRKQVVWEMAAFERTPADMPVQLPRLNLPHDLPFDEIRRRYIEYCTRTTRPGPTEWDVDTNARHWYEQHVAPEATTTATNTVLEQVAAAIR